MVHCYSTGDGNISFCKGTLAPPGEYDWTWASFGALECTTDTANGSVQSFLHSLWQKVPILYRIAPSMAGHLDLSCNTWCFRPIWVHNPNGTSIGSAVFAQMAAECLYTLQWFACFPSKLLLPMLASGPHLIRGSLGPPESGTQMATWSFQPFLHGWQTDRATEKPKDHATKCDAA